MDWPNEAPAEHLREMSFLREYSRLLDQFSMHIGDNRGQGGIPWLMQTK